MAFVEPITIREVIENIHRKKYLLPAIQREFVWDTYQIERLFDSLMCDCPISSFLFWQKVNFTNLLCVRSVTIFDRFLLKLLLF